MRFTIPLLRQKKSALRDPRNKFIPPLPPKPATPPPPATTPPPPATTELPARKYDKVCHLNQLGKKLIYGNTYHVLVVGEDDFSTTKRLARDFGGTRNLWAANFCATSEHPAGSDQVKRRDAREWIKLLTDAGAAIGFSIPALSIATNDWVRGRNPNDAESTVPLRCFDRVVFYQPRLDYRLLGCFLFEARRVLKKAGQVHLLSRPANPDQPAKSPHLTWPLETLGSENGLVCSMQIEIPWGGEKHNRPWTLVVFTLPVPVVPVEENSKV